MFAQLYFYIFAPFIVLLDNHCNADPLRGEHVELAKKGEFPFVVSISDACNLVVKENHVCGGALISNKHVLTAAHCIKDCDLSCVTVIIDSIDFGSGKIRHVETCKTYDDWAHEHNILAENADNDLAILTLSRVVNEIQPAKISALTRDQVMGASVVTAGWGELNDSVSSKPDILRKANLKVLTAMEFHRNEVRLINWTGPMPLNAYYTSADPPIFITPGDSGSPLLLASNNEIVGVNVARYPVPKSENNPIAMTKHHSVDYYRDFINAYATSKKS